ncbi:MAG: sulfite exporter TauE/SafE family protein [bacterium]
MKVLVFCLVVFVIASLMAMTGRGGGNFYVPLLVLFGLGVHAAATTAQLILVASASAAMLIYHKNKNVDWKLALVIDPPTDLMALFGGYYAHLLPGRTLKIIFSGLLLLAAYFMFRPVKSAPEYKEKRFGFWRRNYRGQKYVVNLWLAIPITALTGFVAGMVGISGGAFKVPLMVLVCGVPMSVAVGTSSAMVAVTALMGFIGHTAGGDFKPSVALPLVVAAVIGGLVGSSFAINIDDRKLKYIFAFTTLLAAVFMAVNAFL